MKGNVTDRRLKLEFQGQKVAVVDGRETAPLTIVRVVDKIAGVDELHLVDKESKVRTMDVLYSQDMWQDTEVLNKPKDGCTLELVL